MDDRRWCSQQSQEEFMKTDMVILVDEEDRVLGPLDKFSAHRWNGREPPKLHRAFSVFLFNRKGEMLLQQRAKTKITFPQVWSNTCCSHPLHTPEELEDKDYLGVKRAAVRKLEHELGIPKDFFDLSQIKFITRILYSAPMVPGYGKSPEDEDTAGWAAVEWGEHELDYVLLLQMTEEQEKRFTMEPNPDEVMAVKFVSREELLSLMKGTEEGFEYWSPWFCKIVYKWYAEWTKDLALTLSSDTYVDQRTIWRL